MNKNKKGLIRYKDLTYMPTPDLYEKNRALRKQLFTLRIRSKLGDLNDQSAFRKLRKEVAQVMTEISARLAIQRQNMKKV